MEHIGKGGSGVSAEPPKSRAPFVNVTPELVIVNAQLRSEREIGAAVSRVASTSSQKKRPPPLPPPHPAHPSASLPLTP